MLFSTEVVPSPTALEDLLLKLRTALDDMRQYLPLGSGEIETKLMAEEEWADAWKKYYKPFHLGHHIFVVPSWVEADSEPGDIRIDLDPGMAFGTGTHETTSMCMELLEEQVQEGYTVMDIGCGSGILGIVAAKVGAADVICSDLDPNAVLVAKENVEKNLVADQVRVYAGDLTEVPAMKDVKADLIVANIIADVIIILAPNAKQFLKQGGCFITSGIIRERRADVEQALTEAGYHIEEVKEQGSWVAIRSSLL